ncbi:MAG TPA: transposase [Streptosporangiaceae bacterium]|jgi:transposase
MESMGNKPRHRRSFTAEFKAEIVELCQRGDRSVGQVARDFDLTETAVREWVRQAGRDAGTRVDGGLASAERQELAELRRECRRLREDVEILKRATVFFALYVTIHRSGRLRCDDLLAWWVGSFLRCPVVAVAVPRCAARQARAAPAGVT